MSPESGTLLDAFLTHAARRPGAIAVADDQGTCDYGSLLTRAIAVAERLRDGGVGPGDRVVIARAADRDSVATALAAFLLGAAYAPMDPDLPPARLAQLVAGCRPAAVVGGPGLDLAAELGAWPSHAAPDLPAWVTPPGDGDVAYVVHTSGSTGVPKAIQVEHRGIRNLLADIDRRAPAGPGAVGSWWTSPGFDVAVWECWAPLTSGGSVAVVPSGARWEADRLVAFLDGRQVASAYVPPSFLPVLAGTLERDPGCCADLRRLLVGVEPIPLGLLQRILHARSRLTILNGYGPAETTVCCTLYTVPRSGGSPTMRTPIGTPVTGNDYHLVDADGRRTSAAGELVITGIGVARGYLGATDPGGFLAGGERAYRTGDLVRVLPGGDLEFAGRVDRQVKIRGHRIEPAEVEAAVRTAAAVQEVVVARRAVAGVGDALAAYVVATPGAAVSGDGIRAAVAARLPYYAVPSVVVVVDAIPQTAHGKVDHERLAALPVGAIVGAAGDAPFQAGDADLEDSAGPADTADSVARAVWTAWRAELPDAAPGHGFVESGGASLGAARVAASLRQNTGLEVSAADVLTAPSPDGLAEALRTASPARDPGQRGRTEVPLGVHEQAIWFHDRLRPGEDLYLEALCFRIGPEVDRHRLARAVRSAAAGHPAFGAEVEERRDGPWLVLGRHLVELDVRPGGLVRPDEVGELIAGSVRLAEGPLCRILLIPGGDRDQGGLLVMVWHHLVVDGWSARLFLDDLQRHYADPGYRRTLSATTVCDLIADRERRAASPAAQAAVPAAIARLADTVGAGPEADAADEGFGEVDVHLPAETLDALRRLARATGVTLATVLLAAWERALCEVFDAPALALAVAVTDRPLPGSEHVAGYLVDTVLVRAARRSWADPAAALRDCHREFQDVTRPATRIPLAPVVAGLRAAGGRRLVDFPVCYLGFDDDTRLTLGGVPCPAVDIRRRTGRFGVTFLVRQAGSGISGRLHHRFRALRPERAAILVATFEAALAQLAGPAGPDPVHHPSTSERSPS